MAGYRLATAEDVPARDPLSWIVSGSTDCSTFTILDTRTDYPTTTARNVYLPALTLTAAPTLPPTVSPQEAQREELKDLYGGIVGHAWLA